MDVHAMADFYSLDTYTTHIKTQLQYRYTKMNDASFIIKEEAEEKAEHNVITMGKYAQSKQSYK
jgi:hypothetical protein